jgi:hypothetical protein
MKVAGVSGYWHPLAVSLGDWMEQVGEIMNCLFHTHWNMTFSEFYGGTVETG